MENHNEKKSIDIYSLITNRIIELIEAGTIPWEQSYVERGIPRNLLSKRPYRGMNSLLLNSLHYESNLFLTWKQIKTIGASVNKGEKGHFVIFTKVEQKEVLKNGTPEMKKHFILRYYKVFNVAQCNELPTELLQRVHEHEPLPSCESVIEGMPFPPKIINKHDTPFYNPEKDVVNIPKRSAFLTIEDYYGVLFHELIHSTGYKTRLNREGVTGEIVFGSPTYSLEELIAELGACFLSAHTGIYSNLIDQNAAYMEHWLTVLKNDNRFIFKAASKAQQAVEYILHQNNDAETVEDIHYENKEAVID